MRGSDGQLHPRAPPKPLRVSAFFGNAIPPPPTDQDVDPSSFYDELVIRVKTPSRLSFHVFFFYYLSLFVEMSLQILHGEFMFTCFVQVPHSQRKGHVDRLRAEEKWQSRARLTETSFGFLEAEKREALSQLPLLTQERTAVEVEDWHFEKPHVCINYIFFVYSFHICISLLSIYGGNTTF